MQREYGTKAGSRMVLNSQNQLQYRLAKPSFEEMGEAYRRQGLTQMLAWTEPQTGLDMLDRNIGIITCP